MQFKDLGLSEPLLKAVEAKGYDIPSPIQSEAIPAILSGKDVLAAAQTGTGKTAGFTLPILERLSKGRKAHFNAVRALVLTPTRELAAQVADAVAIYSQYLTLKSAVVFGGVKINPQMIKLRRGVDVLVATPGRLLDLYSQNAIRFDYLEVLVLDEADRMLDMGFIHDIKKIIRLLPKKRQNLMFSATFSSQIRQLAQSITHYPIEITVSKNQAANAVTHWLHPVDKKKKPALLRHLIDDEAWEQVLVFCRTKHGANRLAAYLEKNNIMVAAIHGNKSQSARTKALAGFKNKKIQVLVATDIAARGIDINQLPQVVNFDLPNVPEDYVHRIGRTGRAGATGQAISLVSADEVKQLKGIEQLLKHPIERRYVDDFEPVHEVPLTAKPAQMSQPKKIKRPKPQHFVKASIKAKWAARTDEDSREAKKRDQKGQSAQKGNKQSKADSKNVDQKKNAMKKTRSKAWNKQKNQSVRKSKPSGKRIK